MQKKKPNQEAAKKLNLTKKQQKNKPNLAKKNQNNQEKTKKETILLLKSVAEVTAYCPLFNVYTSFN